MPTVVIKTALPLDEYKKFKEKASKLQMSEYQLLQTIVRGFLKGDIDIVKIMLVLKQAAREFEEIMSCKHCP